MLFIGAIIRRMVLDNIKAGLNTSRQICEIYHWNISCASSLSFGRFPSFKEESSMTELRPLVVRNFANLEVDSIHSSSFCSFMILSSIWQMSFCRSSLLWTTTVSYSFTESNSISWSSYIFLQGAWRGRWRPYIPTYPYQLTGYLWITKVSSVENTAALQTFCAERKLGAQTRRVQTRSHVFSHWSLSQLLRYESLTAKDESRVQLIVASVQTRLSSDVTFRLLVKLFGILVVWKEAFPQLFHQG